MPTVLAMTAPITPRSRSAQAATRRRQLAEAALVTLSELGYARSSLREIASNSPFSHGIVHYYFADKKELMAQCVELYIERATARYEEILAATDVASFEDAVVTTMQRSVIEDLPFHRISYDVRTQSMFDPDLAEHAKAITAALSDRVWAVIVGLGRLKGSEPLLDQDMTFSLFDGLLAAAVQLVIDGRTEQGCDHIGFGCRLLMASTVPSAA